MGKQIFLKKNSPEWKDRQEELNTIWNKIMSHLGNPYIQLLPINLYKKYGYAGSNDSLHNIRGIADKVNKKVCVIGYSVHLELDIERLYHELGHVLFPEKAEWWIEGYGYIMSGGGHSYESFIGESYESGKHSINDLPDLAKLQKMSVSRAKLMRKYILNHYGFIDECGGLYDGNE
jgi:hypothetical protein